MIGSANHGKDASNPGLAMEGGNDSVHIAPILYEPNWVLKGDVVCRVL